MRYLVSLSSVNSSHVEKVGGKNASLGEMLQHLVSMGINVPDGFATTTDFYKELLAQHDLDKKIIKILANLKVDHLPSLEKTAKQIRSWIMKTPFSVEFSEEI